MNYKITTLKTGPFWCSTVYSDAYWGDSVKHTWSRTEKGARDKAIAWVERGYERGQVYKRSTIEIFADGTRTY